ncbi:MAG: hypothetical protein WBG42_00475 [Cryomorphaceae bacterium]
MLDWSDTILGSRMILEAEMNTADSYEWHIETERWPKYGKSINVTLSDFYEDTLNNLDPENPDFYRPLEITLIVRNQESDCVNPSDTLLTHTSHVILTRKTLTGGTFFGRVEGENFDRHITLWESGEDLSHPNFWQRYFAQFTGLEPDTMRWYGGHMSNNMATSYKKRKWQLDMHEWWFGSDGIQLWEEEIINSLSGPDRIELYYERYPEEGGELEKVRFSGVRVE